MLVFSLLQYTPNARSPSSQYSCKGFLRIFKHFDFPSVSQAIAAETVSCNSVGIFLQCCTPVLRSLSLLSKEHLVSFHWTECRWLYFNCLDPLKLDQSLWYFWTSLGNRVLISYVLHAVYLLFVYFTNMSLRKSCSSK